MELDPHNTTMSFSVVFFHNPNFTISSSSSSFRPRRNLSSSNHIFTTNQPKPLTKKLQIIETLAARDTIIDFGKHKGKMLGTLPSSYLKWVSKNLRAGDTEYWAKLADEVLEDDVYKDRSEWEIADKILRGSDELVKKSREDVNSVSMLLEISEKFGWDNEDKIGWSKVNFELLGTSKGGRIPRLRKMKEDEEEKVRVREIKKKEDDENGRRRRQRRERLRQSLERDDVNRSEQKGVLGKLEYVEKKLEGRIQSPFPGRESLLKKVMMNKRRSQ